MLNRDDIAHEYAKELLRQNRTLQIDDVSSISFDLADAMIAEAQKRKSTERPSVVGDGWISVEDQVPHKTQPVLVFGKKIQITSAWYHPDCNKKWTGWFSSEVEHPEITHWQPLPQAPK